MSSLTIFLLGPPRVELDGVVIGLKRRKVMAILAYLVVAGERQRRDTLAALLWPESDQSSARKALRRHLSELNLALDEKWLDTDRESVALRPGYWLDVIQFHQYLAKATDHSSISLDALVAAAGLYRGEFLSGFTLSDSSDFDEWQSFQSESLRQSLASALEQLIRILSNRADYNQAIPYTRRWLALDPLHEPAHRQLMQIYARAGQQAAAVRQYDLCRQTLEEELGISPSQETTALYNDIRIGRLKIEDSTSRAPRIPLHNLPTQTTTFVGRQADLADIKRLLLDEPGCRLLNLVGPGGIGKTRLALAAAAQSLDAFPDGVYFVGLTPVGEAETIVPAIAEVLRLTFFGNADPKAQLLDYLSQKRLLLIVDNFEHLLDGANLLSAMLAHAPYVTLLATSRERLYLQEEWCYEVRGLLFPTAIKDGLSEVTDPPHPPESSRALTSYSAIELFLQRARQALVGFVPSVDEMADIGRICQVVEGMPLGLELAAAWRRTLSCREIAAEIERSLDFLATTLRNTPERHRSLRVVFEQTWERLSDAEQTVLSKLSVFRGGCTRTAAEHVTGATLPVLSSLIDKGLLRRTSTGRYELHELIRQFAESQLQTDPLAVDRARQRHRDFFVSFLEAHTDGVKGRRQLESLAEIESDIDNVRLAWRRSVANRESEAIERSAECLFIYHLYRNGYDEGRSEFGWAVAAFADLPNPQVDDGWLQELVVTAQQETLVGFLLAGLGYFLAHRRNLQQGQALLEQALALLRRAAPGARRKVAFALVWLGWAHYFQGQTAEGERYARESLTLFTETADHWGEGWALLLLGNCLRDGHPLDAEVVYQTGLTLCRDSGDQIVLSYLSLNLGVTATALGRYVQAQHHIDLAVTISEQRDNVLGLGYALFSRGRLEIAQGKYRQAIQTLQQALSYFNKVGTVHASRSQIDLGLAHHLQGEYDLAAQSYIQALDGLKAANSILDLTRCLNCLGCLAYDQGKLHQAEQFHRESLALLRGSEKKPALVAASFQSLGQVMVAAGEHRHAEARNCLRQALALALEHLLAPIALDACLGVAQLLARMEERERAAELLALVEQHEASTFETRKKARHRLIELVDQLPRLGTRRAQNQEQTLDLWTAVQTLLPRLATDAL